MNKKDKDINKDYKPTNITVDFAPNIKKTDTKTISELNKERIDADNQTIHTNRNLKIAFFCLISFEVMVFNYFMGLYFMKNYDIPHFMKTLLLDSAMPIIYFVFVFIAGIFFTGSGIYTIIKSKITKNFIDK